MKRKRENSGNLVHRLLRRETTSAPPAATISQSRRFFESVVPNTAIKGIQPPPGYCLSRFSPCGRFLISFDAMKNEVVLHSYRGINIDLPERPPKTAPPAPPPAEEGSNHRHRRHQQQPPTAIKFEDAFDLHARCPIVTSPDEQLFAFSLAVHTDYLILASSTPDARPVDGEGGAWLGVSENVTFHLLNMLSGQILDRLTLRADSIHLTHLGAASLFDDIMTVVAPGQKKIYVVKIEKEGVMRLIRTIGPRCREDDAYGTMTGFIAEQQQQQQQQNVGMEQQGVGNIVAAEEQAFQQEEDAAARENVEEEEEEEDNDDATIDRRASEESEEHMLLDDVPSPLLIEGLKQRLLARLYLDAVAKTKLLAADLEEKKRLQQQHAVGNVPQHQVPVQPQRTVLPIEQFYYFFDVYLEMEMHAVLLISPSRVLITWMPRVNHRNNTSHLPSHIRGLHMLYDMDTTAVERVFEGGSIEFIEWCLATAPAATGGAPSNDWERYLIPGLWGQHVRRRAAQDPFLRATVNHPGCQQQQGSPYLDPEIFQFDERAVTRDLVPRPPLHRPAKFVARVWPERLRFKFEPEDVMGEAAGNNRITEDGENATEVVFIFHPVAPFVIAAVESTETGLAEELAFFTHNS